MAKKIKDSDILKAMAMQLYSEQMVIMLLEHIMTSPK